MFYMNKYLSQFCAVTLNFTFLTDSTIMSDMNALKWLQQLHKWWFDRVFTPVVFPWGWNGSIVRVFPVSLHTDIRECCCFLHAGCRMQEEPSNDRYQTSTAVTSDAGHFQRTHDSSSGLQTVARNDSVWSRIRDYLFLWHDFTRMLFRGERCLGTSPAGQFGKHELTFMDFITESGKRSMKCSCFVFVTSLNIPEWSTGILDSDLIIIQLTHVPLVLPLVMVLFSLCLFS